MTEPQLVAVNMKMRLVVLLLLATVMLAGAKTLKGSVQRNKLLLISFDGFRWNYDEDVDTPNMDQMRKDGVTAKYITPPMLTMTGPSHFTTITGNTLQLFSSRRVHFHSSNVKGSCKYISYVKKRINIQPLMYLHIKSSKIG